MERAPSSSPGSAWCSPGCGRSRCETGSLGEANLASSVRLLALCSPFAGVERFAALTFVGDHDVVVVPIAHPQDVGGHAVTSAGLDESLRRLKVLQDI